MNFLFFNSTIWRLRVAEINLVLATRHNKSTFLLLASIFLSIFFVNILSAQLPTFVLKQPYWKEGQPYSLGKSTTSFKDNAFVLKDMIHNRLHAVWVEFDNYKSVNKKDSSLVYYTSSQDDGKTWSTAKRLSFFAGNCLDTDSSVKGPNLCLGANSELYVTWAGPMGLAFQVSLDQGITWLPQEKIINPIKNGWEYIVNGIKANGLPHVACNAGTHGDIGRIYICWGDEKYGKNHKDIFLVYSDDKGLNWTEPILVNYHPNHKERFFPKLRVDQTNGDVYVLYYDQQNCVDQNQTEIYLARSRNGGLKFEYYRLTERPLLIQPILFSRHALEFNEIESIIGTNWTSKNEKSDTLFYSAVFDDASCATYYKKSALLYQQLEVDKTIAFANKIKIPFNLQTQTNISAILTKPLEPDFEKIIVKNKTFRKGNNSLLIDSKLIGLKRGNYVITLYYAGQNKFAWITEE
jgi:hypothetical protein